MLGVFLAIDGNYETQIQHMRGVAEKWHEMVRVGYLTRCNTWAAFNTTVTNKLECPLLAPKLTEK